MNRFEKERTQGLRARELALANLTGDELEKKITSLRKHEEQEIIRQQKLKAKKQAKIEQEFLELEKRRKERLQEEERFWQIYRENNKKRIEEERIQQLKKQEEEEKKRQEQLKKLCEKFHQEQCPVCMETIVKESIVVLNNCFHWVCCSCEAILDCNMCPLCRQYYDSKFAFIGNNWMKT